MTEEKIMTLHPQGKKGVNILKRRYETIKNFIIKFIIKHLNINICIYNFLALKCI